MLASAALVSGPKKLVAGRLFAAGILEEPSLALTGGVSLSAEPLPVGEKPSGWATAREGITRPARSPVARKVGRPGQSAAIGRAPFCARGAEPHRTKKKAQSIGLVIEYRSFIVDLLGMRECDVTKTSVR